jgi:hypothetical protein
MRSIALAHARHEASHAVARWALYARHGFAVDELWSDIVVRADADDGRLQPGVNGRVNVSIFARRLLEKQRSRPTQTDVEVEATVLLAGPVSDGTTDWAEARKRALPGHDIYRVGQILASVQQDHDEVWFRLIAETEALLREDSVAAAVADLVEALLVPPHRIGWAASEEILGRHLAATPEGTATDV